MALNFSHRPVFPGYLLEDNLVDPNWISNGGYLVEGIEENNVDAFGKPWLLNSGVEDRGRERCDMSGSKESVSKDILDMLPSDPFGMDISSTFTAITGWLEDLEAGYGGYGSSEVGVGSGDYQLFAGLNFIWNNALRFQAFQGNMSFNFQYNATSCHGGCSYPTGLRSASNVEGVNYGYSYMEKEVGDVYCHAGFGAACKMEEIASGYGGCSKEIEVKDGSCPIGFGPTRTIEETTSGHGGECSEEKGVVDVPSFVVLASACNMEDTSSVVSEEMGVEDLSCSIGYMEDILSHGNDRTQYQTEDQQECCPESCESGVEACMGETPRLAMGLAIGYLGVRDLLSVESVCKYLRATVRSEPYLWTRIHIDRPLNEKITDDLLLQLTDRAQGELQSLSLLDCTRITDDGLKCVLESNPKLTKLSVPGCSKLTIEGIVNNLKSFKSTSAAGIEHLKTGALYGAEKYFEELKKLLGIDSSMKKKTHKPHFFHTRHLYMLCDEDDDDRALDIAMCPKCERVRLIYDCSAEGCQRKEQVSQVCRACTLCIQRCFKCGRCITDGEYEETFCLDWLCSFCKRQGEDLAKSDSPSTPLQP